MKILVILVVMVAFATAIKLEDGKFVDYRFASKSKSAVSLFRSFIQPRAITCTAQGKICDEDCKKIWTCVKTNEGGYKPNLLQVCTDSETCNNGSCNKTPSPECAVDPAHKFVCQSEGVFPDPRTCKKYHYCIKKDNGGGEGGEGGGGATKVDEFTDNERTCSYNKGYNSRTTYCDKTLVNDQCGADYPVPVCKAPGQHEALKDNASIFYACSLYNDDEAEALYPYLYLCRDGWVYDGNYGCKAK